MKPPAPRRPAPEPDRRGRTPRPASAGEDREKPGARLPGAPSARRGSEGRPARASGSRPAGPSGAASAKVPIPRSLARPVGQSDAASILGAQDRAGASDLAMRRRERARARRSFYARNAAWAIAGIAVLAGLVWLLLFSPLLALDASRVSVTGAEEGMISVEEVAASAAPYSGVPLPRVPTARIAESIEKNPVVAEARVSRAWPAGLSISLVLRAPAMAEGAQGAYTLVDAAGVAFRTIDVLPEGIPVVSLPDANGDRAGAAQDSLAVWNALGPVLRPQVLLVSADGRTVSLSLASGATVKWGTPDDAALKAKVLEVLVAQRAASVYDVSAPAHPVTS